MRFRRNQLPIALVFVLSGAGAAQDPTLRVTTRVVEIGVVAEADDGTPAAGLTAEDFTIFDEGRPEKIVFFNFPPREPQVSRRKLAGNFFSNRVEYGGGVSSATVILFDGLNTHITDQAYARQQVLKFVEKIQPGEQVALYVLGRGPRVLLDFTSDPKALGDALAAFRGELTPSLDLPLYDPAISAPAHFHSWIGELTFDLIDHFDEDRAFRTARTMISIANHLERIPGRKNLIWVSASFPISIDLDVVPLPSKSGHRSRTVSPEIERAARALNNANLAVYPVDARGLMAPQEYRADLAAAAPTSPGREQATFATMRTLAERTGGRAFYNNNDLSAAMRRATEDASRTYILGYYPSHDSWNGKFREIKVQVGRPGVKIVHRKGYFAQPDEPEDAWYREQVLDAALWSPMNATGIGLTVGVTQGAKGTLDLDLQIDARDITFAPRPETMWESSLDLWLVQLDRQERQIKTSARTNTLRLNRATYDQVRKAGGLRLIEHVTPEGGARLLRVLVRDVESGALGSVTVPLERFRDQAVSSGQ